jgi:hypothetical protein
MEAHNGDVEGDMEGLCRPVVAFGHHLDVVQIRIRISIPVKSRVRIRISKTEFRIRINKVRVRNLRAPFL